MAVGERDPRSPQKQDVPPDYPEYAKRLWLRFVCRPILVAVGWLDTHDSLITALATVAIAAFTVILAIYAREQGQISARQTDVLKGQQGVMQRQLNEMAAEQRAWVGPIGIAEQKGASIKEGKNLMFYVQVLNTGRLPATHVNQSVGINSGYVPGIWTPGHAIWQPVAKCRSIMPSPNDSGVILPSDPSHPSQLPIIYPPQWQNDLPEIRSGKRAIIIRGCIAYRSGVKDTTPHRTGFCYVLMPNEAVNPTNTPSGKPPTGWLPVNCPVGFFAT